ncbi:hypothetical protein RND71_021820 [Anisodus tanguticus]|uniref:Retrotransposon gag domain-containing protein n=1 Tax=Anisodus tanguticus TaxID=243964 RepID=A0AAE1VDA8_9SOLA|nr:hypothetical protein RND71_021820 [Anisodus tanguticus]
MFNGSGNSMAHLPSYCDHLVGVQNNPTLIMRLFTRSLTREASEWFVAQNICQWITWEDMMESFMDRYKFNIKVIPDRYYLKKIK